jgi:hypothetical protein
MAQIGTSIRPKAYTVIIIYPKYLLMAQAFHQPAITLSGPACVENIRSKTPFDRTFPYTIIRNIPD